jgi:glycosyltransferase involved in cell wall biosynthesis
MRILIISTGLSYGGAEAQLVHLATHLRSRGHDLWVVSLTPLQGFASELKEAGIPVLSLDIRRKQPDPRPLLRLARVIRRWRPHVVHSHMVHANIFTRIVRLLAPVPVLVCTAHNIEEASRQGSGRLGELAYRITDFLCDITTQVSRAGVERYVRIGVVPRHKIRYIPNGVDTFRFKPDPDIRAHVRTMLGVKDAFMWLAVGRFQPQKDYPNLLQAFAQLVSQEREALLVIAGDGPLRPLMETLALDLGLKEQVKFLGLRRDVPDLMKAADAYVMSSAWEGMPMVLLEAAATGLPIVATNVGGNSEVVMDGQTGFLVPPKDPRALAEAMLRLMRLPYEIRQKMGQAGRARVEAQYALERVVDQWEALYYELLKCKRVTI